MTWYYAVCDRHQELIDLFVDSPTSATTTAYFASLQHFTARWLIRHQDCNLRLMHRDDQLDPLWGTYRKVKAR